MDRSQNVVALTAALAAIAVTGAAHADTFHDFIVASGNWKAPSSWANGEPMTPGTHHARIDNSGTALIGPGDAATPSRVYLGSATGTSGALQMSGGTINTDRFYVGNSGSGLFTQNAGAVTATGALHIGGDTATGTGTYHFNGGTAAFNYGYVGQAGTGTLNNNGAALSTSGHFYVGNSAGSNGTYNFDSGTHVMTGEGVNIVSFRVGNSGNGVLNLGDADSTGSITETAAGSVDFIVRAATGVTGTVRGWGTIALDGVLQNNGRIIADGYGQSRTLDLTSFASVTIANGRRNDETGSTGTNGWFAVNRGRLALPTLTVGTSAGVSWGENSAVADNDAVNSLRITTDAGVVGGDLDIALLAQDHNTVDLTGVITAIGIWSVDDSAFNFGTGAASVTIRYDDALASALAVDENDLQVLAFDGVSWQGIGGTLDVGKNTLSVSGLTNFATQYAVGVIPEPATMSLLLLGVGFMIRGRSPQR